MSDGIDRRSFLVLWLQMLFLALFPWLRTERGFDLARIMAETTAKPVAGTQVAHIVGIVGAPKLSFDVPMDQYYEIRELLPRHAMYVSWAADSGNWDENYYPDCEDA